MGLADFLAQAGQHTAIGQVAQAFGGQTGAQRNLDYFINNDLPALAQEIQSNTDETKIPGLQMKFIQAAGRAGIPLAGIEKLSEMMIGPALAGMRRQQLDKIRTDYSAQPAQPRPQGTEGPLTESGNFIDPRAAKPLDQEGMLRLGQALGANPAGYSDLLKTPSDIAAKETSNQRTQAQLDAEQAKERAIQGLSNEPPAPGLPPAQAVARINPAGIAQFLPQREQSQSQQEFQQQMADLKQQGLENALTIAGQRVGAANDRATAADTRAAFNQAAELRKEFQSQSKNYQQVRDSYNRIQTSAQSPTPAGDLSMLYNYMKMLDPGSVVRESEFRSAATAKPMLERLGLSWDAIGSVWNGNKMTPGMRQDFLNRASQLYNTENQQHSQRVNEYKRVATGFGVNPNMVITDMEATGAPPPTAPTQPTQAAPAQTSGGVPAVGTVSKGYRFKGGNPADRKNWEKVQ